MEEFHVWERLGSALALELVFLAAPVAWGGVGGHVSIIKYSVCGRGGRWDRMLLPALFFAILAIPYAPQSVPYTGGSLSPRLLDHPFRSNFLGIL